jgi:hypothetical protein
MSMAPITWTFDGKSFSLLLTTAALNSVLTAVSLAEAFQLNVKSEADRSNLTQAMWADTLAASSPASLSQIPPNQIRDVLAAALAGGGLNTEQPADAAWRIHQNQNGRDVELLVAAVVKAALAAA